MEPKAHKTAKAKTTKKGRTTKSKLTLSVVPKYVAMLRRASTRKGRSITELVEDFAVSLDKEPALGKKRQSLFGAEPGRVGRQSEA